MVENMIIDCISDLHGELPELEGGDLLIIAGDITGSDRVIQWKNFYDWFKEQKYTKKVYIAGNHDGFLRSGCTQKTSQEILGDEWEDEGFEYLCDSGCEFEYEEEIEEDHKFRGPISYKVKKKVKIWGSPWTPEFCNWYFMKPRSELKEVWDQVPDNIDILITHGPAWGILDKPYAGSARCKLDHLGCTYLRECLNRVKPKLHVFGHIHGGYGQQILKYEDGKQTICVNAAIMDENYNATNKPIRIEL